MPKADSGERLIVLGGTGFIGRALAFSRDTPMRPLYLVHRTMPDWLAEAGVESIRVDLDDPASVQTALLEGGTLVNLIRPDGQGSYPRMIERLVSMACQCGIARFVHASSIDVYAGTPARLVDEETAVQPASPYEKEHCEAERIVTAGVPGGVVLRFGAVFGSGGRNVAGLADEFLRAAYLKLALRRLLYGNRRMHLVSVETTVRALVHFACRSDHEGTVIVTQDDDPHNNFIFLQDTLAEAFARPSLRGVPTLPPAALRLALRWRGLNPDMATRRFSSARARSLGLDTGGFADALKEYARQLAVQHRTPTR